MNRKNESIGQQQGSETGATTLSQLIEELALPAQGIAIAVDNHIVLRTEWPQYALREYMSIIIIKAACGG